MPEKFSFPCGKPQLFSERQLPEIFSVFAERLSWNIPIYFSTDSSFAAEEYALVFNSQSARITAASDAGKFYGLQSLLTHISEYGLTSCDERLSPLLPERALKLYLPEPTQEGFDHFYRIIDFAARCKYNTVVLELGGALEYKRHPEINASWVDYCRTMSEYPGKTLDIMNGFYWHKNSIHSENGGGRFLSQEQFMLLVNYCRERFMQIIPEMPSLSHSDYMLAAHPHLAERPEDPFPDTCCPQNPGYHQLYQDLMEEVIELLSPEKLHFGHDEFYSSGLCPVCRGKKAHQLYAADVNRLCAYLEGKNIQPVFWGEKLLDSHWRNGEPIGGAELPETAEKEGLPACYPAAELITGHPEIYHWYWNVDRKLEEVYIRHNWKFCLANFNPPIVKDWQRRVRHASGICVSNWGQTNMRTLQRNGVFYNLAYAALLLWNKELGSDDYPDLTVRVFNRLYREFAPRPDEKHDVLSVLHTVQTDIEYQYFFDGFVLDEKQFFLGNHVFQSEKNGELCRLPVIFGTNISNSDISDQRIDSPSKLADAYECDNQYKEISCETLPEKDEKGVFWFRCRYQLPAGIGPWKYLRFEKRCEAVPAVRLKAFELIK